MPRKVMAESYRMEALCFLERTEAMGILSEMDMMNRDAEDDAFEVSSDSETVDSFSEEFEPVEPNQKPTRKRRTRKKPAKRLSLMPPKPSEKLSGKPNRYTKSCWKSRNWTALPLCRMTT